MGKTILPDFNMMEKLAPAPVPRFPSQEGDHAAPKRPVEVPGGLALREPRAEGRGRLGAEAERREEGPASRPAPRRAHLGVCDRRGVVRKIWDPNSEKGSFSADSKPVLAIKDSLESSAEIDQIYFILRHYRRKKFSKLSSLSFPWWESNLLQSLQFSPLKFSGEETQRIINVCESRRDVSRF